MIFFRGGAVNGSGVRSGLGGGFRGLLSYLYEGTPEPGREGLQGHALADRVDWISSRNLPHGVDLENWQAVERHFSTVHGRTDKPVYHVGIALEPGVTLDRQQWEKVADRLIEGLGLQDHRVLLVAHKDSAHQHVHLVVHRVNLLTDRVWQPSFDGIKAATVLRGLERELGIRELGTEARPALRLTSGELAVAKGAELPPLAARARADLLADFQESVSWGELVGRVAAKGYGLEVASRGGGVVVVGADGLRASVSRIDSDLSGPKLAKRYGESLAAHLERAPAEVAVRSAVARSVPETSQLADELGGRYATWTRGDAMRELAGRPGREQLVAALVSSPHVVRLPASGPGRAERFASVSYLAQELSMLDAAGSLARFKSHGVAVPASPAVARLSAEQSAALEHVASGGLGLVVGRAGAGKTTLAAAIAEVHRSAGYEVLGVSLAAKAARGLEEASGIPSSTVASLLARLDSGQVHMGRRTLLVVDEAGILDTAQLAGLLDRAAAARAKVVLMGDPDQLQPIGAGAPFRGLLQDHDHAELGEIRRQRDPAQAAIVGGLAQARVAQALSAHDAVGRIDWHTNTVGAREAMADRWISAEPSSRPLLVAYRRADVAALNEAVQERRSGAGELGDRVGVGNLRVGDQVVFGRNGEVLRGERVQNGVVGRLEGVSGSHLRVSIPGRAEVQVDPRVYGHLELGYALSLHRSQGQTSEKVEVLADRLMDRHALYVALSRHRDQVRLHVPVDLAAATNEDRRLLERAAVDGRLKLAVGEGLDVRALSAPDRVAIANDVAVVDQKTLVAAVAERMSVGRTKGLARDERGELDYAAIMQARSAALTVEAQANAARQQEKILSRRIEIFANRVEESRGAVKERGRELVAAAMRAYVAPRDVLEQLEQRHSARAVSADQAQRLAALRGADRAILGPDAERLAAVAAVVDVAAAHGRLLEARGRLASAQVELAEVQGELKSAAAKVRGLPAFPGVGVPLPRAGTVLAAGRALLRADAPEDVLTGGMRTAAQTAAMAAAGSVSPQAGRAVAAAAVVAQANTPESAFLAASAHMGKMALSAAVTMLPPVLRLPATYALRALGKVVDVGIER